MKYRYKPGDRVRVKQNLELENYSMRSGPHPGVEAGFISDMKKFCGKIVTIGGYRRDRYQLKEDVMNWLWTDDMFENSKQLTCHSLL